MPHPTHHDRARAIRAVLAKLRNDGLSLRFVLDEAHTPDQRDQLTRALIDMFAEFMRAKLPDPHRHAANWIATEMINDRQDRANSGPQSRQPQHDTPRHG